MLGTGGDNSNGSIGSFFEGVMTRGLPSDATENAVQANLVTVNDGGPSPFNFPTRFLRDFNNNVFAASNGRTNAFDATASFTEDVSWVVSAPWAPERRPRARASASRRCSAAGRTAARTRG